MSENPRRGRQARNFTTYVPKILDLKSFSEQIFFRKLSLGAPVVAKVFCLDEEHGESDDSEAHDSGWEDDDDDSEDFSD